jgi:hypothetical protein
MPTMLEIERKRNKKDLRGRRGDTARADIMVDTIVLDHRTREHVDALLECFSYPDSRLVGLSAAEREDRMKEILEEDGDTKSLSADCRSFADLQALARMYRQIWL